MMRLIIIAVMIASSCVGQTITTYLGTGLGGYSGNGGPAISAQTDLPAGIFVDTRNGLLFCQTSFVRRVNITTSIVNVIAGSDTASSAGGGGDGGPATCALVFEPYDVTTDANGNYYIADYWTNRVRKVDASTGTINVYAGSSMGNTGDGGPATAAKFGAGVTAVCIDTGRRYLYISDAWNYRVRRVDMTTGIINAFAGTGTNGFSGDGGPATAANFSRVFGLALDRAGNVYIGDWDNHRIRKVSIESGIVTTIAGNGTGGYGGDGGPATAAALSKPTAICFDTCGNLYFSDEDNNRVRRIDVSSGVLTTVAGNGIAGFGGDGGPATAAQFNHPTGVCIDKNFNLYVGDYYNHRVRKVALGNCEGTGVGVNDVSNPSPHFTLHPNPTTETLTITAGVEIEAITIVNVIGQSFDVAHDDRLRTGGSGERQLPIDVTHLPPGVYMVRVNEVWTGKFVKE